MSLEGMEKGKIVVELRMDQWRPWEAAGNFSIIKDYYITMKKEGAITFGELIKHGTYQQGCQSRIILNLWRAYLKNPSKPLWRIS